MEDEIHGYYTCIMNAKTYFRPVIYMQVHVNVKFNLYQFKDGVTQHLKSCEIHEMCTKISHEFSDIAYHRFEHP